ncbi:MAG: hypothetical protein HC927_11865 [Deltaproteobacteria bacterium]|nr:hypothetical protein [Deltaproteobacteria bacterium]
MLDADRTLAEPDTGRLVGEAFEVNSRIRSVFAAQGYSTQAFANVSEIWSGVALEHYSAQIERVATAVELFACWSEVLVRLYGRRPIFVVTSGIPQVWRQILNRCGFADIPVLGGCHPATDEFLMDAETKRRVVAGIQARGLRVAAAGDSLIDEAMLRQADFRIVVPDAKGSAALRHALAGADNTCLLCPDDRRFADLPLISPMEIVAQVLA